MGVRRVTQFIDDLDGSAAAETVWFAVDGVAYEVDLSAANAAALRSVLGRYVTAARPVGRAPGSAGRVRQAAARARHAARPVTPLRSVPPLAQDEPPAPAAPAGPPAGVAEAVDRAEPAGVLFSDHQPR